MPLNSVNVLLYKKNVGIGLIQCYMKRQWSVKGSKFQTLLFEINTKPSNITGQIHRCLYRLELHGTRRRLFFILKGHNYTKMHSCLVKLIRGKVHSSVESVLTRDKAFLERVQPWKGLRREEERGPQRGNEDGGWEAVGADLGYLHIMQPPPL